MNTWEDVKEEIIERLDNPTKEQIAEFIEKAYKLGYVKGIDVWLKELQILKQEITKGLKDFREEEGL